MLNSRGLMAERKSWDFAGSDHEGSIQECLVAREVLEQVEDDSIERRAQGASDHDGDGSNCDREATELAYLQQIFAEADERFRARFRLDLEASTSKLLVHKASRKASREG